MWRPVLSQAGLLDRLLGKGKDNQVQPVKFDRLPPMEYSAGPIEIDYMGRLKVGNASISLGEHSRLEQRGREASERDLRLGTEVRVMGYLQDDGSLLVHRLTIIDGLKSELAKLGSVGAPVGELPYGEPN